MLNRKVVVGLLVTVLAFVGIFAFALPNDDNQSDKDNQQGEVENPDDENKGNEEEETPNPTEEEEPTPSRVVNIEDNTDPEISDVQLSTTEWTKGGVVLTVVATDNNGVTGYSFNGGEWQTGNSTTITTNGNVEVRVRDAAGNITTVNKTISNIDIAAPTVVFETNGNSHYSKVAGTKITVTDNSSIDPATLKYAWTTSTTAPDNTLFEGGNIILDASNQSVISTSTDTRFVTAPTGIYYLWVLAKDTAGNGEPVRSEAFYLDNTVPVISNVTKTPDVLTNGDVTLTVTASDTSSELDKLSYSYDNGTKWVSDKTFVVTANKTVSILVKDEAGNVSLLKEVEVTNIDKVAPTATVTYDVTIPTKGNVVATIHPSEPITVTNNEGSLSHTFTVNGNFTFEFVDAAGNNGSVEGVVSNIDKTAPQTIVEIPDEGKIIKGTDVKIKVNSTDNMELAKIVANLYGSNNVLIKSSSRLVSGTNAVHEYDFNGLNLADGVYYIKANALDKAGIISNTVTRHFVVDSTKPTIKVNLNRSGFAVSGSPVSKISIPEFQGYDENLLKVVIYKEDGTVKSEALASGKERRAKVTHLSDGKYTIVSYDKAGNQSEPFILIMDSTAPIISTVTGNVTEWTNKDVTLTVNASDASGIGQYSFDNGTTWVSENTKVFTKNQTVRILVKDVAGNVSLLKEEVINKIDKNRPKIQLDAANQAKFYSQSHSRKLTVSDTESGVDDTSLRYVWTQNREVLANITMGSSFVNNTVVTTPVGANGEYYLVAYAKDKAGNEAEILRTWGFYLDNTAPIISTVTGNVTEWTNKDVTLTVNASDNTSLGSELQYSFDNGTTWGSDNTKVFTKNQTVSILVKDVAGNVSLLKEEVINKIDKNRPKIQLDAANQAKFYSQSHSRKLTVSDTESGVDETSLRYVWTQNRDVLANITMGSSFVNNTVVTTPVGANGEYYLVAYAKDKAGNEAEILRTWGFYLDNTAPSIPTFNLNGYNEDWTSANIFISLSSSDAHSGVLTHQMRYNEESTWQDVGDGVTFANTYNMTVQFRTVDKAGNVSEPTRKIIIKQDNTAPSIPTFNLNGYNEDWTNANIFISLSSSDAHSGVLTHQMRYNEESTWQNVGNGVTFANAYNMTVQFRTVDKVGNVSEPTRKINIKQDKTAPTTTLSYKNDKTLGQTAVITANEPITIDGWNCEGNSCEKTYSEKVNNQEVIVRDLAGNPTSEFVTITEVLELASANFDYSSELKYFQSYNVIFNRNLVLKNGTDYDYTYQYSTDGINFLNSLYTPNIFQTFNSINIRNMQGSFAVGLYPNLTKLYEYMLPITINAGDTITRVETKPWDRLATIANLVKATTSSTAVYARIKITVSEDGRSKIFYTPVVKYSNFNGGVVGSAQVQ